MIDLKKARLAILLSTILIISLTCIHALGKNTDPVSPGPAPNSGDGIPDGSGFASFDGQGPGYGPGPAPNSGDGVPDGPGW